MSVEETAAYNCAFNLMLGPSIITKHACDSKCPIKQHACDRKCAIHNVRVAGACKAPSYIQFAVFC